MQSRAHRGDRSLTPQQRAPSQCQVRRQSESETRGLVCAHSSLGGAIDGAPAAMRLTKSNSEVPGVSLSRLPILCFSAP